MKKMIALTLICLLLLPTALLLTGCSNRRGGLIFEAETDDDGKVISYYVYECTASGRKKDKIKVPAKFRGKPVTSINYLAFDGAEMTEVVLPEGLVSIEGGFENCPNLTTVNIPSTVVSIDAYSFRGSPNVGVVENGYRYVDGWLVERVGADRYAIRADTVGTANITLGDLQDENGNVILPEGLQHLGYSAFKDATIAGDVVLPSTLKVLRLSTFENATIDGTLALGRGLERIDGYAFQGASIGKLVVDCDTVLLDNSDPYSDWDVPFRNTKIKEMVVQGGSFAYAGEPAEAWSYSEVGKLIAPAEALASLPVAAAALELTGSAVPAGVFKQVDLLESIVLHESVTAVGASAFAACRNLKSLTVMGESLTLGDRAFYSTEIKNLTAPAAVLATLPTATCQVLTVTKGEIAANALQDATALTTLTINEGVRVADGALDALTTLKYVTAPAEAVAALPVAALQSLKISSGTALAAGALSGAAALTEITLPATLTTFGADAFLGCTALKNVNFGGSAAVWATARFANGAANPLSVAQNLFTEGVLVTELHNVNELSAYAFYGYELLTAVSFGAGLTKISEGAFASCVGLTALTVTHTVTTIGASAFADCTRLTAVTFEAPTGWIRLENETAQSGLTITEYNLADATRAATCLTNTYRDQVWRRIG